MRLVLRFAGRSFSQLAGQVDSLKSNTHMVGYADRAPGWVRCGVVFVEGDSYNRAYDSATNRCARGREMENYMRAA